MARVAARAAAQAPRHSARRADVGHVQHRHDRGVARDGAVCVVVHGHGHAQRRVVQHEQQQHDHLERAGGREGEESGGEYVVAAHVQHHDERPAVEHGRQHIQRQHGDDVQDRERARPTAA